MRGPDAARGCVQDPGTASLARGLRQCRCRRQARGGRVPRSRKPEAPEWIEVGVVTGAHGLRGEVRVKPFTDFAEERFRVGNSSWLQRKTSVFEETGEPEQAEIEFVRSVTTRGQLAYLLKLDSVSGRDEAERMKGATILVKSDERGALDNDTEFYAQDLIGLEARVRAEDGAGDGAEILVLGTVVDLYDGTGVHDTLDIEVSPAYLARLSREGSQGKASFVLVPFVRDIVPFVNTGEGYCEIDPPAGLLEACLYTKKRN